MSRNAAKNAILGRAAWRGKTKGGASRKRKNRFPRFKKKGIHDSFRADNGRGTAAARGASIRLPRIGWLREELRFAGDVASVTVSRRQGAGGNSGAAAARRRSCAVLPAAARERGLVRRCRPAPGGEA